jgi:hypothetical protein
MTAMEQEIFPMLVLDLDPAFEDFNFSYEWDPTMKYGPSNSDLYRLVQKCRQGGQNAIGEFADAMYWTLREFAFDAFQRAHGARAIGYREWFYRKLFQFFEILLFTKVHVTSDTDLRWVECDEVMKKGDIVISSEGPVVQQDELQDALGPENNIGRLWLDLTETVSRSSNDRLTVAREWLRSQRAPERNSAEPSGWTKNQERNQIIMNCLARQMKLEQICQELDKRTIPTLPASQAKGIHRWVDGWADPLAKKAIQQLLSKLPKR